MVSQLIDVHAPGVVLGEMSDELSQGGKTSRLLGRGAGETGRQADMLHSPADTTTGT